MSPRESAWKKCLPPTAHIDFIRVFKENRVRRVLIGTQFSLLKELGSISGHEELKDLVRLSRKTRHNLLPQMAVVATFMWLDGEIGSPFWHLPQEIPSVLSPDLKRYLTLDLFNAILDRMYNIENKESPFYADRFYPALSDLLPNTQSSFFSASG